MAPDRSTHQKCATIGAMRKVFLILLLLAPTLCADDSADIKAINATIGALYIPQVREDPKRMAEVTTPDFDGNLDSIPVHAVWCETSCVGFRVRSLKFITPGVAFVDGETTGSAFAIPAWLMILKKDAAGWRISAFRALGSSPSGQSRLLAN